ncbi:MAG TPA: dihydroorotate dehydrogenase [Acidimicrobiales bacterium]
MTRRRGRAPASGVDLTTSIGSLELPNPVMTASGTAGHGAELGAYLDLGSLGAVVVKSLSDEPWPGNPAPRVHPTAGGMLNSVGLQGPGVEVWLEEELPALQATGARIVASIWARTLEGYYKAASMLAGSPPAVVAVEVNVSCPNIEDRRRMFAHSPSATAEALDAASACGRPRWAKLSPNVTDITEIAAAALGAGAEALTLVNTVMGLAIDVDRRHPVLGGGGGGLSGPAIRPVGVRAVFECHAAFPGAALIGAGGVGSGRDAVEYVMAGARAVQVGTATFADPRAPARVLGEISHWCRRHGVVRLDELIGAAHG